ncbi:aldo/keto reductase [Ornithinibacillus halotolerans]|uniref:Aldo/keto reductase n=1 Tax=Ornithinibacillus halotolerans TaxID=1274357 RepID=A0A916S5X7_9BACI|nr:aldo/keto reductase [Ornithinibacillus halotolerans]GGA83048.1 aldo/keto reductase [Ornithinibacillus halotolerans]
MKVMPIEKKGITTSRLILGCMGFGGSWDNTPYTKEDVLNTEKAIDVALSNGITMFDHADIYRKGKAEKVFGEILQSRPELRENIVLQSKCGIRFADGKNPGRYDLSKDHILNSVDGILDRLNTDYLDILLLHRPDPLMEPEEIAEAFELLRTSGKVRHFGVSNMNASQIKILNAYCSEPMVINQLNMSLKEKDWIEEGVLVNQKEGIDVNFPEGMIEYCRLTNIQLQAWAPLANGIYSGRSLDNPSESELATIKLVEKLALEKDTSKEAIVLAWLMRHPAMIQPVIGTTNPERITKCQDAIRQAELMTREEWYSLYVASRGNKLP